MSKVCKVYGIIQLAIGTLGSLLYVLEMFYGFTSFIMFILMFFGSSCIALIFYGLGTIIENQELILELSLDTNRKQEKATEVIQPEETPLFFKDKGIKASPSNWQCPQCGKINPNYTGTCSCGQTKY